MKHTLTLSRWHKVVERLNAHAKSISQVVKSTYVETNVQSFSGEEQIAELNEQAQKAERLLNQYLDITKVVSLIRSTLAKENVVHGVSGLVAEQEHLSRNISFLKQIIEGQSIDMVKIDKLESNKALTDPSNSRYGYNVVKVKMLPKDNQDKLEETLANSQSRVHALSDELSDINKKTCMIEVPEDIARIAGLV